MKLLDIVTRKTAEFRSWLRAALQRGRLESEMEAELQLHLEQLTDDLVRAGHSPAEAARRARIALGPALLHKEGMRASLGLRWLDEMRADVRYGIRILAKSPSFTLIAALSLALAIGANTTIFSLARQMLYQRLGVPHADELRLLRWNGDGKEVVHAMWGDFDGTPNGGTTSSVFSYRVYQFLREHNQVLGDLAAFKENSMNATMRGNAQRVNAALVSGNYFSALEVNAELGRTIEPSDDVPGAANVAVISDAAWQREFGRSASVLGQTITLNQIAFTVVGVAPRGFTGAKGIIGSPDLFVPIVLQPSVDPKGKKPLLTDDEMWWVNIVGRRKPGIADATAQAELDVQLRAAVHATIAVAAGDTMPHLEIVDGSRGLHFSDRMFKKPIYVLLALTGFVILLACANIANLLLARGAQRQREMSVRLAMGSGRARILRQLLIESLLLAGIGGAFGLMLGYFGRNALPNLLTNAWERHDLNASFDWGVFAFTAGVTLVTGILFGLAPALLASQTELNGTLKDSAQNTTRRRKGLTGKSIVAFQIALSTLLVIGAGLFARTLWALNAVPIGFDPDHLVLFEIAPPGARYPAGKDVALHALLQQKIAALPGVTSSTAANMVYVSDSLSNSDFMPEGESFEDYERKKKREAEDYNVVGNAFFETMKIPIMAGRAFAQGDTASAPKVAVINEALAQKRFPGVNPIGRRFKVDRNAAAEWIEIVGICANNRYVNLRDEPPAQFFVLAQQQPSVGSMVYEVRASMEVAAIAPSLRHVVQSIDPDLPLVDLRTQREQINATMQIERAFAALMAGFGVLALALACVGVYGIMAYSVAQRTNEIGIRLALGAEPGQVRRMFLRESTWLTGVGIAAGLGAALGLTRLVKSMLYGVTPNDPATLAAGVALLLAVALVATWIPARRAAAVQPMQALRHE
jgi:predicted permease